MSLHAAIVSSPFVRHVVALPRAAAICILFAGCGQEIVANPEAVNVSLALDSALVSSDSVIALQSLGIGASVQALPDLLVVQNDAPVAAGRLKSDQDPAEGEVDEPVEVNRIGRLQVFRGRASARGAAARFRVSRTSDIDFAVPAFVTLDASRDTLVFANRIVVTFKGDVPREDAVGFARRYRLAVLRAPMPDSGWSNYHFAYPQRTRDPIALLRQLRRNPMVATVEPDFWGSRSRSTLTPNDPLYPQQFNLNSSVLRLGYPVDLRAQLAWTRNFGGGLPSAGGTRIVVIDDGIWAAHPDLQGAVSFTGINRISDNVDPLNPPMPFQHGTAVAGMIASARDNAVGVSGLAPGATVYAMKIFQIDGQGNSGFFAADLADGIDQARVVWNPHIMNMSLGIAPSGQVSSAISRALTLGRGGLGIVMVGSSGNDASSANPGSVGFPASVKA